MFYAYMVRCSDNTIYSGYTNDIDKRLLTHNSGKGAKYTARRLPVRLIYYEEFEDRSSAMKREAAYKKLGRKQKEELAKGFKRK